MSPSVCEPRLGRRSASLCADADRSRDRGGHPATAREGASSWVLRATRGGFRRDSPEPPGLSGISEARRGETERAEVKEQPGDGPAGFQAEGKGQRVAPQAHPSDPTAPGPMSQTPRAHALTPGQGEGGRSPVPTPATCPPSGNGVRMRKLRSGTSRSQDKSSTSPQIVLALTVTA